MAHHTKDKGDLAVLKAQADLCEQGYTVCIPLTEYAPFDLVVYKEGEFRRVQVKYKSVCRGAVEINFRSYWTDRNGSHRKDTNKSGVDVFCVYCPETNECYYFDVTKFNRSATLRVEAAKNSQTAGINNAYDYRRVP